MATVHHLLQTPNDFYAELQDRANLAEGRRHKRFHAVLLLQRMARGYLIRKHIAWLSKNATIIQCAFRVHRARKAYRAALRRAVWNKDAKHYGRAATILQALWRGYYSRRTKFCYQSYRKWLATVRERGERRAAEAAEFGIRSRADILSILEEEARQWLAFVVFKLHHLLRTYVCAGVYSEPEPNTELSDFEKLLKSIHYTEYMKRLKRKYNEFVRKYRPRFSNKRLFPIIGDGSDYWYLSLPEMYELTSTSPKREDTRHLAKHHGSMHKKPFLWKKVRPSYLDEKRGPFMVTKSPSPVPPSPPAPSPTPSVDVKTQKDPRFHLYVKHYKPQPDLFDYVDYHINLLLARKCSIENIDNDS